MITQIEITGKKLSLVLFLAILVAVTSVISTQTVRENKDTRGVACSPNNVKFNYPYIPYLPAFNQQADGAKLYSFIAEYIRLRFDENPIDYKEVRPEERFKTTQLRDNLQAAMQISMADEKQKVMELYRDSHLTFKRLLTCRCGWQFNIDAIESIYRVPINGFIVVTVLGEFSIIKDGALSLNNQEDQKNIRKETPPEFWGYRRITFYIGQGVLGRDSKDNPIGNDGLYVYKTFVEDIPYENKHKLFKQINESGYLVE